MNALNRVELIGNLGKDPEVRYLENGVAVAKFTVATTEKYRDKEGNWQDRPTEWHDIVCWRYLAERAEKELKKGKSVYVTGSLTHRTYEDANGIKRYVTEILARSFRVFERQERANDGRFPSTTNDPLSANKNTTTQSKPVSKPKPVSTPQPTVKKEESMDEIGDDLPF